MEAHAEHTLQAGTPEGHIVPGSILLLLALQWTIGAARASFHSAPPSRSWYPLPFQRFSARPFPIEPALKVLSLVCGVLAELYIKNPWVYGWNWYWRSLRTPDGLHFTQYVDSWHHASIYAGIALSGATELGVCAAQRWGWRVDLPMARTLELSALACAMGSFTFTMTFHAAGQSGFIGRIHTIQSVFLMLVTLTIVGEAALGGRAKVAPYARSAALTAAATWLIQNGFIYLNMEAWRDPMAEHVLPLYATFHAFAAYTLVALTAVGTGLALWLCERLGVCRRWCGPPPSAGAASTSYREEADDSEARSGPVQPLIQKKEGEGEGEGEGELRRVAVDGDAAREVA